LIKKLELLSPAGNIESGIAAINAGADAVYIGAPKFGARAGAGNPLNDIEKLIRHAHLYNAKVYIALNTLLYDNEVQEAIDIAHQCWNAGADALIIQDLGLLEAGLPPIPLFASTQLDNRTAEKVLFLQNVGFKRIILARELSLTEIAEISKQAKIELEAFVHGALCVSYSGQCFISHAICNRSANRGECAQICRSKFNLLDKNKKKLLESQSFLSLKDLNLSDHINDMVRAGISSFKIEGRMKDVHYVRNITGFYRKKIDEFLTVNATYKKTSSGIVELAFEPDPEKSFSRAKTSYFLKGRVNDLASWKQSNSIGKKLGIVKLVHNDFIEVEGEEKLNNGDGLCFLDKNGNLKGVRVEKVENDKIFLSSCTEMYLGLELYRNLDHEFVRKLDKTTDKRSILISIRILEIQEGIQILARDEDNISTEHIFEFEKNTAQKPENALKAIQECFSKQGNSALICDDIKIEFEKVLFFTNSFLNQIRRKVFQNHEEKRINTFRTQTEEILRHPYSYPTQNVDYSHNILNHYAEEFLKRHGVLDIQSGFENRNNFEGTNLMTCRYCIKYQMGQCPKENAHRINAQEEYFLENNKNLFKVVFDCKKCEMKIVYYKE